MDLGRRLHRLEMYWNGVVLYLSMSGSTKPYLFSTLSYYRWWIFARGVNDRWRPPPPRLLNSGPTIIICEVTSRSHKNGKYCLLSEDGNPIRKKSAKILESFKYSASRHSVSFVPRGLWGSYLHHCHMPISLYAIQSDVASLNNTSTH
jgi:hypothetical protein